MTSFLEQFKTEPSPPPATSTPSRGFEDAVITAESDNVAQARRGTRNATLNKAAFNLAQALPVDTWHATLMAAAAVCGLDQVEAHQTIRSGIEGARRNPRPAHRMPGNRPERPVEALRELVVPETTEPVLIDWDELWADPGHIQWLCEPLIPAGRLVSLYSPPGVGKSLLGLQLAAAISNGTEVLGTTTTQTPVLYLDYENVAIEVRDRLQDMSLTPDQLAHLHYWSFPDIPPLDTAQGGAALLEMALSVDAGLVVIDTLSRCVQGEENEASTMLNLYRCTLMPLKARGTAVLRLDHTGKDETRGQRGTSAKSGDVDMVWRYTEIIPDQTFLLTNEKHRMRITETSLNIRRTENPTAHHVDTRTITQAKTDAILHALDAAGLPLSAGRDVARRALDAAGIRIGNNILASILRSRQGLPPLEPGQ